MRVREGFSEGVRVREGLGEVRKGLGEGVRVRKGLGEGEGESEGRVREELGAGLQ